MEIDLKDTFNYIWGAAVIAIGWLTKKLSRHDKQIEEIHIKLAAQEVLQSEIKLDIIDLRDEIKELRESLNVKFDKIIDKLSFLGKTGTQ